MPTPAIAAAVVELVHKPAGSDPDRRTVEATGPWSTSSATTRSEPFTITASASNVVDQCTTSNVPAIDVTAMVAIRVDGATTIASICCRVLGALGRQSDMTLSGLQPAKLHNFAEERVAFPNHGTSCSTDIGNDPALVARALRLEACKLVHRTSASEAVDRQAKGSVPFHQPADGCAEESLFASKPHVSHPCGTDTLRSPLPASMWRFEFAAEELAAMGQLEFLAGALRAPHTNAEIAVATREASFSTGLGDGSSAASAPSSLVQLSTAHSRRLPHLGTTNERYIHTAKGEAEVELAPTVSELAAHAAADVPLLNRTTPRPDSTTHDTSNPETTRPASSTGTAGV
jgi:hypothetical protein